MARPIQFDRDDVLNKALGLFWSDGYEASSVSRLLNVMGLNRGSLYSSFSDKRTLFKEVLDFYFRRISLVLLKPNLIEVDDQAESIRGFFTRRYFMKILRFFPGDASCSIPSQN